jgi:carbonic anhydrase/acetyltransferase-like protein (isoleucine patch superfamily)
MECQVSRTSWSCMLLRSFPLSPSQPLPTESLVPLLSAKSLTPSRLGPNVYINSNSTWIDTLPISIGARTLVGPNCAFYSGSHPLDPFVRNGTSGPEAGAPVSIGEDCWLGGNVVVLPGVTIGRGTTIGAGSVVTRDIPEFVVAVGNPARVIRKLDVKEPADWAHSRKGSGGQDQGVGGGVPEAGDAKVPLPVAGGRSVQVLEGEKIVEAS